MIHHIPEENNLSVRSYCDFLQLCGSSSNQKVRQIGKTSYRRAKKLKKKKKKDFCVWRDEQGELP